MGQYVQAAAEVYGAVKGSETKPGGRGMPKWQARQIKRGIKQGNRALNNELATADGAIAPLSPDTLAAQELIRNNVGYGRPQLESAMGTVGNITSNGITEADIDKFRNPYIKNVVDATNADFDHQRSLTRAASNAAAETAGAFGGDRGEVANVLANEQDERLRRQTVADLYYRGNDNAQEMALRNAGLQLSGAGSLESLIQSIRAGNIQDAENLNIVGNQNRQYEQSRIDYPLTRAQRMIGLANGTYYGNEARTGGGFAGAVAGAHDYGKAAEGVLGMWDQLFKKYYP